MGGWLITTGYGTEMVIHYWCPCCIHIFCCCITFGNQMGNFQTCLYFLLVPWPLWLNKNNMSLYNIHCVWIVSPNISHTDVPVNHFPQKISQRIQSPLYLGLPRRWCKYPVRHKSGTRVEWWLCWCQKWILKGLQQKIVLLLLNSSHRMKMMHARKTKTVTWMISNASVEQWGSG